MRRLWPAILPIILIFSSLAVAAPATPSDVVVPSGGTIQLACAGSQLYLGHIDQNHATAYCRPAATSTATATATRTAAPTNTARPTATNTPTNTPTATHTPQPTATNTPLPTATPSPTATSTPSPTATPAPPAIRIESVPFATSKLELGVTMTQYDLDNSGGNATARARATSVLTSTAVYANAHLMGFGANNPWPDPSVTDPSKWNWESLDRRMTLIKATGRTPILTLCCAPTWMTDGDWISGTDWAQLENAPLPEHEDAYVKLVVAAAKRYPQVQTFLVWNELKGFWDPTLNRWNYERYTRLYNKLYDALKTVRPDARIGGPYAVVGSFALGKGGVAASNICGASWGCLDQRSLDAISYWLKNKHGADFIVVDAKLHNRDHEPVADLFAATIKFLQINGWLRSQTDLPIVLAEWYVTDFSQATPFGAEQQGALGALALVQMLRSDAWLVLRWAPQAQAGVGFDDVRENLWKQPTTATGGTITPLGAVSAALKAHFGPGTVLYLIVSDDKAITGIASDRYLLLINASAEARTIFYNGQALVFAGYEVRAVQR